MNNVIGVSLKLTVCAVYTPSPPKVNIINCFLDNASNVMNLVGDDVIMGDINLGNIAWIDTADTSKYHNDMENALIYFMLVNRL